MGQPRSSRSVLPEGIHMPTRRHSCQYDEQIYDGEIGDGSCAVVRGSSEEARAERNGLVLIACLLPETRVMPGPGLCLGLCLGLWYYCSRDD